MKELIEITLGEETIHGYRQVSGKRKLTQRVFYIDKEEPDLCGYKPKDKDGMMLLNAQQMLYQMVIGRCLNR